MQTTLIVALKSLRAILARGPQRKIVPYTDPEIKAAIHAVMRAANETDEMTGEEIGGFLATKVNLRLMPLPAPPMILRQLDTMIADLGGKQPSGAAGRKRRRASDKPRKPRRLTPTETETIQIVGECKGNMAAAARRLGKDRKTVEEAYRNGLDKLGKEAYWQNKKTKTRLLTRDRREQETVSIDSDRF